jgi:enoyl-CoA hydratase/carnithine racemase
MAEAAKKAEAAPAAESKGDKFEAAKVKAPGLTKEFVAKHNLDDEFLEKVARGEEPPPPTSAEVAKDAAHTDGELHLTPGGWQVTPKGVKPEDVGKDAISR